jgi:hypothetical protein
MMLLIAFLLLENLHLKLLQNHAVKLDCLCLSCQTGQQKGALSLYRFKRRRKGVMLFVSVGMLSANVTKN